MGTKMKLAALLVVMLSNQGYWFGGHSETITLHPAVRAGLPGAALFWELRWDHLRLDSGKLAIAGDDQPSVVHLNCPTVRVRLMLHWSYRIVQKSDGKELGSGDVPIEVFPDDLLADLARRVGNRRLVVLDASDASDGLAKTLTAAKLPFTQVSDPGQLQMVQADAVLVGQEMLAGSPLNQGPLSALAESGTSVMAFHQSPGDRLFGYRVTARNVPAALQWREDHPLLFDFSKHDLQSWTDGQETFDAVDLPADAPALDIGSYPRETPGRMPAPIDAVALTKSVGKGRLVWWQIRLGSFAEDPRSQMLLANAIDYLLTRPQPTPPPSQRPTTQPCPAKEGPIVNLAPRGNP
jgi:hypothetical protein